MSGFSGPADSPPYAACLAAMAWAGVRLGDRATVTVAAAAPVVVYVQPPLGVAAVTGPSIAWASAAENRLHGVGRGARGATLPRCSVFRSSTCSDGPSATEYRT